MEGLITLSGYFVLIVLFLLLLVRFTIYDWFAAIRRAWREGRAQGSRR